MWLLHIQCNQAIVFSDRFYTRQTAPRCHGCAIGARYRKLHHVMSAEAGDQIGRRSLGDDLAVIDNGEAIAEPLSFVHVVRGEQHGAALALKYANDIPQLPAALRIKPGRLLVETQNFRIADERSGHGKTLPLPTGKFADPGVSFFGELQLVENFVGRTRLAIKAGKQIDGLANRQFF